MGLLKQLKASFSKRKPLYHGIFAAIILLVMFFIALFSSRGAFGDPGDSAIVDEIAHIPAGYTYVKDQDFRLNPEHPPLAKALAGIPLALNQNIIGPEGDSSWPNILQWDAGWHMLYRAGNDPKEVLDLSRLPMMLLMIALGVFLVKWASELFGRKVGLIVLLLYAFYPDVLAHGRLVTTDIAAALGYLVAIYYFDKAIEKKTWTSLVIAGIAFGLAQLLKFSAFLLFFVFLILVIVRAIMDRKDDGGFWPAFAKNFKSYFWVCLFSLIVVWLVYIPFTWNTPAEVEHEVIVRNLTEDPRTLPLRNFLHTFEANPILRGLGHYLLGVMLVIARVEGGNKTFILGHLSDKSISWYFPVAWLLKTSIPIILGVLFALFSTIVKWPADKKRKWTLVLLLTPIVVYWAFTLKGSLNIGIRHLMPTVPFVLLWIGYAITPLVTGKLRWPKWFIAALLLYFISSTLYHYPTFISYFNEATPKDIRYQRLIDSSLDWGQDLLRLQKYVEDNQIENIKVDYFGGGVPSYSIPNSTEWHSYYGPTTGWLAVSATFYQSSKLVGPIEGQWSYNWLDQIKPKAIIGGSILVYNITSQDLRDNPPNPGYPITDMPAPDEGEVNQIFDGQ